MIVKILITGGAGFIGSNLKEQLRGSDSEILTIGRTNSEDIQLYLSSPKLKSIISEFKPNIVFHLASGSNITRADKDKQKEFNDTVISTNNLVQSLSALDINSKLIYLSSQTVYGIPNYLPVDELHPVNPRTVYGENKLVVENIIKNSKLKYWIFRVSSVYGLGQDYKKSGVIAKFINCMRNNEPPIVYNSYDLYFDFIYVKDLIDVLCIATHKSFASDLQNEVFNLGSNTPTTLEMLLEILYGYFPRAPKAKLEKSNLYLEKEHKGLYLDINKIKLAFNWQPKYNIEAGLNEMLKEFKLLKKT